MSTEANKAIVRRLVEEGINQANEAVFLDLLSPDVIDHAARPGLPPGRAGWNLYRRLMAAAFPDGHWTIEEMVAEGDRWRRAPRSPAPTRGSSSGCTRLTGR